ncbi:hypothetical protein CBR_g50444 [Chara braunii]|uniref:G-patch domain-containing protein n=1 Tax=Chara braunii TaxID=69332 RepID=A0A388M6W3_CHABU|nr:hypothetical protein CBR_g50444 [Chara braunii]|eukprot:GBG90266.1 hypothetical protein CBR_g50444 [Chara braunii]
MGKLGCDPENEKMPSPEKKQHQTFKFALTGPAKSKSQHSSVSVVGQTVPGNGKAVQSKGGGGDKRKEPTEERDYVTAIDRRGLVSRIEKKEAGPAVIPLLEDSWKLHRKRACPGRQPIMSALGEVVLDGDAESDRFEEVAPEDQPGENVRYGLEVRKAKGRVDGNNEESTVAAFHSRYHQQQLDAQAMQREIDSLPDVDDTETYETMPIELFGEALLRGMGWEQGKPLGRRADSVIEPMEYRPRPDRLGLGAVAGRPPQDEATGKKQKTGDRKARGPRADMAPPIGSDGRVQHVRNGGENHTERTRPGGVAIGKTMEIIAGRHSGLRGVVLSIETHPPESGRSDRATVRLETGNEKAVFRVKELADIDLPTSKHRTPEGRDNKVRREEEEEINRDKKTGSMQGKGSRPESQDYRAVKHQTGNDEGSKQSHHEWKEQDRGSRILKEGRGLRRQDMDKGKYYGDSKVSTSINAKQTLSCDGGGHQGVDASGKKAKGNGEKGKGQQGNGGKGKGQQGDERKDSRITSWLMGGIKVRIVNKELSGGKVYLKKATVADVVGFAPATRKMLCDVVLDENGKILQGVDESSLETVLPKRGGRVLIVSGSLRGQGGRLMDKNLDKGWALVQLHEDLAHVQVQLDDVAEFVGGMQDDEF